MEPLEVGPFACFILFKFFCVSCIKLLYGRKFRFFCDRLLQACPLFFVQSFYFYGSLWFCVSQDWLEFEEGFDEQWGKSLLMGTNFFSNPKGNVINIEFEETLLAQRQIRVVEQIMWLYELNDVYYVCSLYCGDRYFRIRVFDLDWNEVVYPGRRNNGLACDPLSSVRFFQAFRVRFIPNTVWNFSLFFLKKIVV